MSKVKYLYRYHYGHKAIRESILEKQQKKGGRGWNRIHFITYFLLVTEVLDTLVVWSM